MLHQIDKIECNQIFIYDFSFIEDELPNNLETLDDFAFSYLCSLVKCLIGDGCWVKKKDAKQFINTAAKCLKDDALRMYDRMVEEEKTTRRNNAKITN